MRERTLLSATVEFAPLDLLAASPRRTGAALAISAAAHVVLFALAVATLSVRPSGPTTPIVAFPVSLVSAPGGGAGGGDAAPAPEPPPPADAKPAEPKPTEAAPPPPTPIARPKPNAKPKPAPAPSTATASAPGVVAPTVPGASGSPGDGSGGAPGGGRGFASANPQYGTNPQPPYPIAARRLGLEGTVVLRVVVAPDGAPREVSVLQSSGHEMLDESALTTVRTRWRFLPARRDGVPIEDSVQVPIRFHRTEG